MVSGARDYQPGERVPGTVYDVVRKIGGGGMGTVYDVEDTTIGKRYVLKALHPQLGAREDLARRMQNEARTLARLNHPNVIEVFTAGVTGDDLRLPFYVMERLNGQSLRVVLEKKGQLELQHAYHIAIDLLDALDHAHDKGVIHRDVKPDNIFLHRTTTGVTITKLLDFGIVSLLDEGRETAGRFLGTLRYAAPEQLRGEQPSPQMDIYAAGLVLFEMIAGRGPFDDLGDSHKIASAHLYRDPPSLARFAQVPPELERLVAASLDKEPERRPRDAFSFASSLRSFKRASMPPQPRDATGGLDTSPAVIDAPPGPAPLVEVRRASPDGPYVVSPGPAASRAGVAAGVTEVTPPRAGSPETAATAPPGVDRHATTASLVADVAAGPRDGTEGLAPGIAPTLATDAAVQDAAAPLHWPAERPAARSEEPQVRSVPLPGPSRGRRRLAATAGAAALGVGALLLGMIAARDGTPGRLLIAPAAAPPSPGPIVVVPAPTLAVPALDDPTPARARTAAPAPEAPASASATPPATATASAVPPASATSRRRPPVAPRPAAPSVPLDSDRPGPGF